MLSDELPNEPHAICTKFGDYFARISVIFRSLIWMFDQSPSHTQLNWKEFKFHESISSCFEHTENMLRSAFSVAEDIQETLTSHSPTVPQNIRKQLNAAFHSLENARVLAQVVRASVLPAVRHASRCTTACYLERYLEFCLCLGSSSLLTHQSSHYPILVQFYRLDDELHQLDLDLDIFKTTVLKDLAHVAGLVSLNRNDPRQCATMIQTLWRLPGELSSGIMSLVRQSSDFAQLKSAERLIPPPRLHSGWRLDEYSGVQTHNNYRQTVQASGGTYFLFKFNNLLCWHNSADCREYIDLLTAAMSIATPIQTELQSMLVAEDSSFIGDILLQVLGQQDPLNFHGLSQIEPSCARAAISNLELGLRRNLRSLPYWIEHLRYISDVIETRHNLKKWFLNLMTNSLPTAFSASIQAVGLYMCYHWWERQLVVWVLLLQYVVLITSYLAPHNVFGSTEWFSKFAALASAMTSICAFCCLLMGIAEFFLSAYDFPMLGKLVLSYTILLGGFVVLIPFISCFQNRRPLLKDASESIVANLHRLIEGLQELAYALRELQDVVDSVNKPHLPYRLDAGQRSHIFATFLQRHVGRPYVESRLEKTIHPPRWDFGGLTVFMESNSEVMADLSHCATTHPDIWIQKASPGGVCELCAQRMKSPTRALVDEKCEGGSRRNKPKKHKGRSRK